MLNTRIYEAVFQAFGERGVCINELWCIKTNHTQIKYRYYLDIYKNECIFVFR